MCEFFVKNYYRKMHLINDDYNSNLDKILSKEKQSS